ncbi:MAG: hypothetical protein KKG04_04160, partial [Candidatus Thermoplasmatota archaeon]|nr:hypothetical protein [Candidatus Thermoplasmatota archaeon]
VKRKITTYVFNSPGLYNVRLTVTDNNGGKDTTNIKIIAIQQNMLPNAPHIDGIQRGNVSKPYLFSLYAIDPDNNPISYHIYWGDGTISNSTLLSEKEVYITSHTWNDPGIYYIESYCRDSQNAMSATTKYPVLINVAYLGKMGYFIDSDNSGTYDLFRINATDKICSVNELSSGIYQIDTDDDSEWEYIYNSITGDLNHLDTSAPVMYDNTFVFVLATLLSIILAVELIILLKVFRGSPTLIVQPKVTPSYNFSGLPLTRRTIYNQTYDRSVASNAMLFSSGHVEVPLLQMNGKNNRVPNNSETDISSLFDKKISEIEKFIDNIET